MRQLLYLGPYPYHGPCPYLHHARGPLPTSHRLLVIFRWLLLLVLRA
jgi:hypothetical protein